MKVLHILIVDDNKADVLLVRQALREHRVEHELYVAKDGHEALQFVSTIGAQGAVPNLDLLLLDLNLPKVDGADVLREFRKHPSCVNTPVVIVSSSGSEKDRARMNELGISRYFQKPADLDEFMSLGAIVREVTAPAAGATSSAARS